MMMFSRSLFLFVMLSIKVNSQEYSDELFENGLTVHQEFMSFEDVMAGESENHFLRGRELQTQATCRATSPSNIYVCGTPGMPNSSCQTSSATCNGMTYGCSCSDSSVSSCSYCRVQTSNAVICQVMGSSMTFALPSSGITTCSCEYNGNGQVRQNCFQPSPRPVPLPTFLPAQWTSVRSPTVPAPVAVPIVSSSTTVRPPTVRPTPAQGAQQQTGFSPTKQKKDKN